MTAIGESKEKANAENMEKVYKAFDVIDEKARGLSKKSDAESDSALKHCREDNKNAAIRCLTRRGRYEQLIDQIGEYHFRLQDVMITLDDSLTKREGYRAFATGRGCRQIMHIESAEDLINEIIAKMEDMKQIEAAISASVGTTPIGGLPDLSEKQIEFHLEMIEEELRRSAAACSSNA